MHRRALSTMVTCFVVTAAFGATSPVAAKDAVSEGRDIVDGNGSCSSGDVRASGKSLPADWTGDFAAYLDRGGKRGGSGKLTQVRAILYDDTGLAVGTCSANDSVVVAKGWVDFDCDFDSSDFNGVPIELVELVSKQRTEVYYTRYLGNATWRLESATGAKQGSFSIDLGDAEPDW